tara:strand:- start:1758 stop:2300 length:543 start_codon:yes stop_codon:yes gene_type:complete
MLFEIIPITKNEIKNVSMVKNSHIIGEYNEKDIKSLDVNYDYLVYKYINKDSKYLISNESIQYIKIIKNLTIIQEKKISDIKSNISFIVVNLQILDNDLNLINTYDINKYLKNENKCYYISDCELFTQDFMNWIFTNYLKIIPTNYIINIMDNNIENIQITEKNYVKLNKNSYEIIEINK